MQKREYIFIVVIITIVFGLYWKTTNYEFIWDSQTYLETDISLIENKPVYSAFEIGYFHHQFFDQANYYRPLTLASFMVEEKLWGINNGRMRLINILIYIISLIFLYIFFGHQTKTNYFPEFATSLFAVFPLNLENIVWVVGRGDLFLLLWGILTLLCLQLFIEKNKHRYLILSTFFYLLGIFSKEAFLFFLPFLFCYEFLKRKKLFLPYHMSNIIITILFFILKTKIAGIPNIEVSFFPKIITNIKLMIATLGYYFKTLIFPFDYAKFISQSNVTNPTFISIGIFCGVLIILALYRSRRNMESLIPLLLILSFVGGHLLFAFSSVFLFKIYARFLMIPALGLIWLLSKYLIKQKKRLRIPIFLILFLCLIISTGINSSYYKNSIEFWQRAYQQFPNDGFIVFQMAKSYFDKEDYLSAELYLNKSLSFSLEREHALTISFLYAAIEYQRADYEKVLKWLESVEKFEGPSLQLLPYWKSQVSYKKGLRYMALGKVPEAENAFRSSIKFLAGMADQKNPYMQLLTLYAGHNMWEKAEAIETTMKENFPSLLKNQTSQIKQKFDSMTPDEKIRYFIHYKNYNKALEILEDKPELDINQKLLVTKLLYQAGKKQEAEKATDEIYTHNRQDTKVLNSLGNLFLKELFRAKQALFYYEKSLEVNKNQPAIAYIIHYLKNEYLAELKEVWPSYPR